MKEKKIYTYREACNIAYEKGKKLSELFMSINAPIWDKPGWVKEVKH
jgi:hypothetical protein